jgi:hypothetical protein
MGKSTASLSKPMIFYLEQTGFFDYCSPYPAQVRINRDGEYIINFTLANPLRGFGI